MSICLCDGFSAPKADRLIVSNLYGVNANSFIHFSVRKDHCDPSLNNMLASVCMLVPTIVAMASFVFCGLRPV